ncbi:MAG: hypothetical protein CML60_09930 [Rhodobacteraceae bacterium]|nr:hypothetical protein [Paracoccaceae bacterium]
MSNKQKVLSRVRKLLNQAESTEFEEEAQTFLAHAERLMTKYDIEEALLTQAGKPTGDVISARQFYVDAGSYQAPQMSLIAGVARAHDLNDIVQLAPVHIEGKKKIPVEVWGYETDLEYLDMLITSLFLQAVEGLQKPEVLAQMADECYYPAHKIAWKNAFMLGFAGRVSSRLSEAADEAKQEVVEEQADVTSQSVELALMDKSKLVTEAFKSRYGRLTRGGTSSAGSRGGSGGSYGRKAGDRARLGGKTVTGRQGALTA